MRAFDIEAAKPGETLKDDQIRGLQLRCFPTGKNWYLYYRNSLGQQRKPKLGTYPTMKLEQARAQARRWLAEVSLGKDPSREKAHDRSSETVAQLCDRFISDYALTNKKPRSILEDRRYIEQVIKPEWGSLRPKEVTISHIGKLRRENVGTPIKFNRCLALISKIWNFGKVANVTKEVAKYPERPRQRFLTDEELIVVAASLSFHEERHPHAVAAIKLLLMTGARMSEIIRCKREWFHGDHLKLEDHKTSKFIGAKIIHLPKAASDLILNLPPRGDYLCGISCRPTKVWNKIVRHSKLPHFTIHDLRRTFVSKGLSSGFTLEQLGKLVGHLSPATTSRYAFLAQVDRQRGATIIGSAIAEALALTKNDGSGKS